MASARSVLLYAITLDAGIAQLSAKSTRFLANEHWRSSMDVDGTFESAVQHRLEGDWSEAERLCRAILAAAPDHAQASCLLGEIVMQSGRIEEAVAFLLHAATLDQKNPALYAHLGEAYRQLGRSSESLGALTTAVTLRRESVEPLVNLASLLQANGEVDGAMTCLNLAAELRANAPEIASLKLAALEAHKDDALIACREALEFEPRLVAAHVNLGHLLTGRWRLDEAIASFSRALEIESDARAALSGLGSVLMLSGRAAEAVASFRRALALSPDDRDCHSNLLFSSHFVPGHTARDVLDEARDWDRRHARPFAAKIMPHANDRSPDRRLRIGYVSPDFRDHCQSFFSIPTLSHHDHDRFEVFCYSNVLRPDAVTDRIRSLADHWREIGGVEDDDVVARIRDDRIDILVDLTMHMDRNRLLVFARKPAPVQVTWLAYPGTTGLAAMDYRVTDPYLDPPESDPDVYAERSLRLPDSFWCYDPLTAEPDVGPLSASSPCDIRFGCLNNFCKVHDGVVDLWARVLRAMPGSRMVLLTPEGEPRERMLAVFEEHHVDPDRIEFAPFLPRSEYLKLYRSIDVCLDTVPYNGHTTSLDAFWMGVPVVTLAGANAVGRAGLCQATNLGLPELVATTADGFVERAVTIGSDLDRLDKLRAGLRRRMERSPLMDGARFTRNLEMAYRGAWTRWCQAG